MGYDIYGNILKRGHCEVHPDMSESYPCSVCINESQNYQNYSQEVEPSPSVFDLIGFNRADFLAACGKVIEASISSDDEKQNNSVADLLKFFDIGYIKHIIKEMMDKENNADNQGDVF